MNILEIEAFLAIIDNNGISNASKKLYVSQSTVSNRLNTLEKKVGERLINRSKGINEISLTPKGEEFVSFSNRYMSLQNDISTWKENSAKYELKVAGPICLNCYTLREFYSDFTTKNYPLILKISTNWDSNINSLLKSHMLDVAIVSEPYFVESLIVEPIFLEKMVMISDNRYSDYGQLVDASVLNVSDEIYLDWGDSFKIWHNQIWSTLDLPKLIIDSPNLTGFFLQKSKAWAIVPLSVALKLNTNEHITISNIFQEIPNRKIYKIIQREQNPSSKEALSIFEKDLSHFIDNNKEIIKIN